MKKNALVYLLVPFLKALACMLLLVNETTFAQNVDLSNEDLSIETNYDKKLGAFKTKGQMNSRVATKTLSKIVEDVSAYDTWALTDINKNNKERGFLVMIQKLTFDPKDGKLVTHFDLNLPWPFNFKDMTMPLYEVQTEYDSSENLKFMKYGMRKESLTLKQFDVEFLLHDNNGVGILDFVFYVKITPLFDAFVSKQKYVKNVQSRIVQLLINLRNYAQTKKEFR